MTTANELKLRFAYYVSQGAKHNPAQEKILLGALTRACGGKDNRYLVTHELFGKVHSGDFLPAEWGALFRFCYAYDEFNQPIMKNAAGKWSGRDELPQWCGLFMEAQARQEGQAEMFIVRMARCAYYGKRFSARSTRGGNECDVCEKDTTLKCHCERASSPDLAFFRSCPEKEFDEFYCGCSGWD